MNMKDVQSGPAEVAVAIDRVGIKGVKIPLVVRDRAQGRQHTVAVVDVGVDLPAAFKGTHMSRFVEALENWSDDLDYASMKGLLEDVKHRLHARKAHMVIRFPYFVRKAAPATGIESLMSYQCVLTGELGDVPAGAVPAGADSADDAQRPAFLLEVDVPVMTVCPCSKAISREGAHSQRAVVRLAVRTRGFCWIEDFIAMAETSASSPVYTLLKREDEKFVTEDAFANPTFVEDVVRRVAERLEAHAQVGWFQVEVESFESIHAHSAFARIERHVEHTGLGEQR